MTGLSARQLQVWDAGGLMTSTVPSHKTAAGGYTERRYTPIELQKESLEAVEAARVRLDEVRERKPE